MSEMRLILNLARCIRELRANKKSPVSTSNIYTHTHTHRVCITHVSNVRAAKWREDLEARKSASEWFASTTLFIPAFSIWCIKWEEEEEGGKKRGQRENRRDYFSRVRSCCILRFVPRCSCNSRYHRPTPPTFISLPWYNTWYRVKKQL